MPNDCKVTAMNKNQHDFMRRVSTALGREQAPVSTTSGLFDTRPNGELDALLAKAERGRLGQLELLATLKETAAPLNLHVHEVETVDDAGEGIATLARTTDTEWGGDKCITIHDNPLLMNLGLDQRLADDAIDVAVSRMEPGRDEMAEKHRLREQAEAAFIGVTGADWCAVDCAAIALLGRPGHGRATSLVPSIHIGVLTLDQLLADLPELYAQLETLESLPVSFNFISGPSKTADIEAQLVHGAHGPREMHLFVITDAEHPLAELSAD